MAFWNLKSTEEDKEDLFKSAYDWSPNEYGVGKSVFASPDYGLGTKNAHQKLEEELEKKSKKKKDNPLVGMTFTDFTQSTTFHGVKYIFLANHKIRKFLWLACVVSAISVFIMQVGSRTFDYFQYNTNVDVQIVYTSPIAFPAVTLCNQNNFRTSVAVDHGLYYFIDEVYSTSAGNASAVNLAEYPQLTTLETESFLVLAAHQQQDFIDSCTWKGEACNITRDIVTTLTDLGVCYTFNSGRHSEPYEITESGTVFGLSLILNVEQYEYMRGPQNDAGIKILLHDQGEFPMLRDLGFAVAPGTHTLVGVERTEVHSMQPPYGDCNASDPRPLANCLQDCRTEMIVARCGCRDIYMRNLSSAPSEVCDMVKQFTCIREQTVEVMKEQSQCKCHIPCLQIQYEPSLSYAQLSKFNIDRMVLNDPVRRASVNNKFLLARELSQRVIKDVAEGDRIKLMDINEKLDTFWQDIKVVAPALSSDTNFAVLYNTLPIVEEGDDMFRDDLIAMGERLQRITLMFVPVLTTQLMYLDKYIPAVIQNLMELDTTASVFNSTAHACANEATYPLPELDINTYFGHSRKKRDHVIEHTPTANFYAVEAPEYLKLRDVDNCTDYLSLKQDLAEALVSHRSHIEADRTHLQTIHDTFTDFFAYMYRNTTKTPTTFPKYQTCLGLLNITLDRMWTDIDAVTDAMTDFAQTDNAVDLLEAVERLTHAALLSSLPSFSAIPLYKQIAFHCYWPFLEYLNADTNGEDYGKFNSYYIDLNNAYVSYPDLQVSFGNLGTYTTSMYNIMDQTIMPSLKIIDDYLAERVTKVDMANVFDSLLLQKALQDIVALSADFISVAREFDQRFKSSLHNVKLGYRFLFNTSLPLIDNDVLWNWEIVAHSRRSNVSHINEILERLYSAHHSQQSDIFAELLDAFTEDYIRPVEDLKLRLPMEIDELTKSINVMMEELLTYIEDNKMNQWFFMENFVQVDVFYKGLSYEEITFHEGFPFLSLLGEIGGFMGLLLGASCLTIIEMVDFAIMFTLKRLRNRMTVQPARDSAALR